MLDDMAVIDRYRLPQGEIVQLLNAIGPQLMRGTRRNFALSPEVQLLDALRYYATGSFLQAQNSQGQWRLLGDSGYPLKPYLFTPVANPVSNSEADFSEAHRVARSIVERTLGRWKLRFRAIPVVVFSLSHKSAVM
ncbi:hypothetical protein QQF64_033828 [Cirrhinus molitorella]|uniref:DDE Tnp4 domain-containing protein n=1 Tax=Cirrhinus molitorella TaxID=172907 RepID=A0ABR3MVA2_9TELE